MPIRAFLVDLDGTLVETQTANARAYVDALAEAGITCDAAHFDRVARGRNWRQFLADLMPDATAAEHAKVAARKATFYVNRVADTTANHALVALIRSARHQYKTALVTNASAASVRAIIAHHGLADLFDAVVTGDDVQRHKPDPQAYHVAASELQVAPGECLVFEDSDIGMTAANAFGAAVLKISC